MKPKFVQIFIVIVINYHLSLQTGPLHEAVDLQQLVTANHCFLAGLVCCFVLLSEMCFLSYMMYLYVFYVYVCKEQKPYK